MDTKYCAIVYAVEEHPLAWGGMLQAKLGGKAVLNHSLDVFEDDPACEQMLLFGDAGIRDWIGGNPLEFASGKMRVLSAAGSRIECQARGAREAQQPLVVLHDALRPNFGVELLHRVLATVRPGRGAAPALPVTGRLAAAQALEGKREGGEDSLLGPKADHRIAVLTGPQATAGVYALQSPQAYVREDYLRAVDSAGAALADAEDDSALCQACGLEVALVRGRLENLRLESGDELHILQKLMGTGPKKKDKYTGLGW